MLRVALLLLHYYYFLLVQLYCLFPSVWRHSSSPVSFNIFHIQSVPFYHILSARQQSWLFAAYAGLLSDKAAVLWDILFCCCSWEIVPSTERYVVPLCLILICADTETDTVLRDECYVRLLKY